MGSKYDIAVFLGATLAEFTDAVSGRLTVGDEVPGPWEGPSQMTVAQSEARGANFVVVAAPPMKMPNGIATRLKAKEAVCATVWDTVGTYSLTVVGEGVNREVYAEPSNDEDDERLLVDTVGAPLPEEPTHWDPSEAYVQAVLTRRYGIDIDDMRHWTWHALTRG